MRWFIKKTCKCKIFVGRQSTTTVSNREYKNVQDYFFGTTLLFFYFLFHGPLCEKGDQRIFSFKSMMENIGL